MYAIHCKCLYFYFENHALNCMLLTNKIKNFVLKEKFIEIIGNEKHHIYIYFPLRKFLELLKLSPCLDVVRE